MMNVALSDYWTSELVSDLKKDPLLEKSLGILNSADVRSL